MLKSASDSGFSSVAGAAFLTKFCFIGDYGAMKGFPLPGCIFKVVCLKESFPGLPLSAFLICLLLTEDSLDDVLDFASVPDLTVFTILITN